MKKPKPTKITIAQYAAARGITRAAVNAKKPDMITPDPKRPAIDTSGRIVKIWSDAYCVPKKPGPKPKHG